MGKIIRFPVFVEKLKENKNFGKKVNLLTVV